MRGHERGAKCCSDRSVNHKGRYNGRIRAPIGAHLHTVYSNNNKLIVFVVVEKLAIILLVITHY